MHSVWQRIGEASSSVCRFMNLIDVVSPRIRVVSLRTFREKCEPGRVKDFSIW